MLDVAEIFFDGCADVHVQSHVVAKGWVLQEYQITFSMIVIGTTGPLFDVRVSRHHPGSIASKRDKGIPSKFNFWVWCINTTSFLK